MSESYIYALGGGMLIGLAAVILWWVNGRVMGVSGILSRLLAKPTQDSWWRMAFIVGLLGGGFLYQRIYKISMGVEISTVELICAGLLVGFGTVWGNGCTSGHGICGIARFSKRSIVATVIFMVAGIITVLVKNMLGG